MCECVTVGGVCARVRVRTAGRSRSQAQSIALLSACENEASWDVQNRRLLFHLFIELGDARSPTWRSRGFLGAPGRPGPQPGCLRPGKGRAHPSAAARWPWSVGLLFSGGQMTVLSVTSSLAHGHPARQGTRAGPWQQTGACPQARSCWQRRPQLLGGQRHTAALWPLLFWTLGCVAWLVGGVVTG